MHDIRAIRENPEDFDVALRRRGLSSCSEEAIALDKDLRACVSRRQQAEALRNSLSREIGKAAGDVGRIEALKVEVAQARRVMEESGAEESRLRTELEGILSGLPNAVLEDVPDGPDESGNLEKRRWGEATDFSFEPRHHVDIGASLKTAKNEPCMDFKAGAQISGARFVVLRGVLARLERALINFMLDMHIGSHGYEEVAPPFLVLPESLYGTGQLPKFEEDLFTCGLGHYAIPTAEVPLSNLFARQILSQDMLPVRLCAATPCFRSEAGASGRDTRGLVRLHQFMKVELVSVTGRADSQKELDRMTACAESVLQALDLPYRVVELCTGDIGFSACRSYDLEVWMPSENRYREISSCSDCGDFQARRMKARYRDGSGNGSAPDFVHTLNGSALAVGRTLAALLENGQQSDGSVRLPPSLVSLMGTEYIGG